MGGTGLVYAWMRYFAVPEDPYALANHPLQPFVQHAHIVTAPLMVFACGLMWRWHAWERIKSGYKPRRSTGLLLALVLAPMVVSGYLLQTSSAEAWRKTWIVVHVATSVVWVGAYGGHLLTRRARRGECRAQQAPPAPAPPSAR